MMKEIEKWLFPIMLFTASPNLPDSTSITGFTKIAALLAYLGDHVEKIRRRFILHGANSKWSAYLITARAIEVSRPQK